LNLIHKGYFKLFYRIEKKVISELFLLYEKQINSSFDEFCKNNLIEKTQIKDGIQTGEASRNYFLNLLGNENCFNFENDKFNDKLIEKSINVLKKLQPNQAAFELGFKYRNFSMRSDIIYKDSNGKLNLIEVKAKTNISQPKDRENLFLDLLYQKNILNKLDYKIDEVKLMYLNKNYVHNVNDITNLFLIVNKNKIPNFLNEETLISSFDEQINVCNNEYNFDKKLDGIDSIMKIIPKNISFDFLYEKLDSTFPEYNFKYYNDIKSGTSVFNLNNMKKKECLKIAESKFVNIIDIPYEILDRNTKTSKKWLRQREAILSNKPYINKNEIKTILKKFKLPIYMFDFETISIAIPIFNNTKPYEHYPFQYSIHTINNEKLNDWNQNHKEYIADNLIYIEEFIESFINDMFFHGKGIYVAYHMSFEKMVIKNLLEKTNNENYKQKLFFILNNLIDLKDLFKDFSYYDIDFNGSASIKYTYLSLAKNANNKIMYGDLNVKNGNEALNLFRKKIEDLKKGEKTENWDLIKNDLLTYCKLDTWSMVYIYQKIKELI